MGITSALVLFAVLWFLTFFVVLPLRLQTQGDVGEVVPGTQACAPVNPNLKKKALITTGVASVLWVVIAWVIITEQITVRDLDFLGRMGAPEAPAEDGRGG